MKPTNYKRGKYNKLHPKEKKITFLSDNIMMSKLKQLSVTKHESISQVIRESIHEYYLRSLTGNE
jgi:hypothetical protein